MGGGICRMLRPFARALAAFPLKGLVRLDDPGEGLVRAAGQMLERPQTPAPYRVLRDLELGGQLAAGQRLIRQHVAQHVEETIKVVQPAERASGQG